MNLRDLTREEIGLIAAAMASLVLFAGAFATWGRSPDPKRARAGLEAASLEWSAQARQPLADLDRMRTEVKALARGLPTRAAIDTFIASLEPSFRISIDSQEAFVESGRLCCRISAAGAPLTLWPEIASAIESASRLPGVSIDSVELASGPGSPARFAKAEWRMTARVGAVRP